MESLDEADGQQEPQKRTEQSQKGSEKTQWSWVAWWNGLSTGGVVYLFALSQILVFSFMFWNDGCDILPAVQNAFDVLSKVLTPFGQLVADSSKDLIRIGGITMSYVLLSLFSFSLLLVGTLPKNPLQTANPTQTNLHKEYNAAGPRKPI